jgi:hypothetical protein
MVLRRYDTLVCYMGATNISLKVETVCSSEIKLHHVTSQNTINFVFRDCSMVCIRQTVAIVSVLNYVNFLISELY